jgi:dipeptidyl aminopeptidase/acylaminoacyl peptidase
MSTQQELRRRASVPFRTCVLALLPVFAWLSVSAARLKGQTSSVVDAPLVSDHLPGRYDRALDTPRELGDFAVAPDGQSIAFTRLPSKRHVLATFGDATENTLRSLEATTLWVASAPDWRPREIVGWGNAPRQFSQLRWSPTGRYLALVERTGDLSRVLIWSRHRQTLQFASPCVNDDVYGVRTSENRMLVRFEWLGRGRVLLLGQPCYAASARAAPFVYAALQGARDAAYAWEIRAAGRRAAVSVLHGGLPSDSMPIATQSLWMVDADKRTSQTIASGPYQSFVTTSGGDAIALLAGYGAPPPSPEQPAPFVARPFVYRIAILSPGTHAKPVELPTAAPVIPGSVRWSSDGSRIAFVEYDWPARGVPCAVAYEWRVPRQVARVCGAIGDRLPETDADPAGDHPAIHGVAWLGDGRLATRVCATGALADTIGRARCDWLVSDTGRIGDANLTASLRTVPDTLWSAGGRTFGVAGGRVLEIAATSSDQISASHDLMPWLRDSVRYIASVLLDKGQIRFTLVTGVPSSPVWIAAQTDTPLVRRLAAVGDLARSIKHESVPQTVEFIAADSAHQTAVLLAHDSTRDRWYVVSGRRDNDGRPVAHCLGAVDTRVRVRPALQRVIHYRSERGDTLAALVILPLGYVSGQRYPVVVTLYPGASVPEFAGDRPTREYSWAAYGYIQLLPGQRFESGDGHNEPSIAQVTVGVLPAIDTLVRLGLADSARIGVTGTSFGGYTVYALLTRTARFRAAIVEAGYANELSRWGVFMPYNRYSSRAAFDDAPYWYPETGQTNMQTTPWKRPDLYIENSPFFRVDRISTPLMIVQGDQDYVPMIQGEQMFNALRRLGRRVDFVRYWGEGHDNDGYWNARDRQQRERAWFAHYLGGRTSSITDEMYESSR